MTHRNRTMDQYRSRWNLRATFIEMFCTVKTAVDNPMMNPSGSGGRKSLLSARRRRPRWQLWLLGRRRRRWSWRIPGCLRKMYFGSGMTMTIHGFKEDFKEEETRKGKGKGKGRKGKRKRWSTILSTKKQRKRKRKEKRKKSSCWRWKLLCQMKNGKDYENETWNEGYWAYEDETAWQSQGWDEWQEYDEYGIFPRKRKERKGKRKERSWTFRNKEKDKVMGKEKQTMWNPSHSSQPSVQQASSTFVSECLWFLCDTFRCKLDISQGHTGLKIRVWSLIFQVVHSWDRKANPVQKVEEEGVAFHTENQMPPNCGKFLDLGCTRAMGSRNAVNAFCDYVDNNDCGLWYKIEPTSSRFFFANSQQTKCTEKLVIHMNDKSWSLHTTEFDIVEEGNVPLLMSLPQMRNLGFQFELSPQKSFLKLYKTRNLEASTQDGKRALI